MQRESTRSSKFHQKRHAPPRRPQVRTTQAALPSRRITQSSKANHNAPVAIVTKRQNVFPSKLTPRSSIRESNFATPESPIHGANIVTKVAIPTQLQQFRGLIPQ